MSRASRREQTLCLDRLIRVLGDSTEVWSHVEAFFILIFVTWYAILQPSKCSAQSFWCINVLGVTFTNLLVRLSMGTACVGRATSLVHGGQ
jgi:hypothetical protein